MNDKMINKIEQFFQKELSSNLKDIAIIQHSDGSYELFNKYLVAEKKNGFDVTPKYSDNVRGFSSLRSAVTWCVFDHRDQFVKAKRIEYLDQIISSTEVSILIQKKLINKSKDLESKLIHIAKMSEEQNKRKLMLSEMISFMNESRNWQSRKFATK